MSGPQWLGLGGAALLAIGLWGLLVHRHLVRRILALNMMGSGCFLFLGAQARHAGAAPDPVAQALVITAIVVALAGTALALALAARLFQHTGAAELPDEAPPTQRGRDAGRRG